MDRLEEIEVQRGIVGSRLSLLVAAVCPSAVGDGKRQTNKYGTMLNVEPKMPISLKFEVTHYSLRMFKYNIP